MCSMNSRFSCEDSFETLYRIWVLRRRAACATACGYAIGRPHRSVGCTARLLSRWVQTVAQVGKTTGIGGVLSTCATTSGLPAIPRLNLGAGTYLRFARPQWVRIPARSTKKRARGTRCTTEPGGERGIRGRCAALRRGAWRPLARCAGKRLRRFLSSAPLRVRIPARSTKKRARGTRCTTEPGGERGSRTPGTLARPTVFKTAAFNRSAISP